MATMPAARYDAAAVGLAGTAYTLGGIDGGCRQLSAVSVDCGGSLEEVPRGLRWSGFIPLEMLKVAKNNL